MTRVLDALVAERVMDRTVVRLPSSTLSLPNVVMHEKDASGHIQVLPYYSTSIGAAWQVVERVIDKAYRIESLDRYVRGENDIVFRLVCGPWGSRCTVVASLDNYGERYATVIGTADAKTMSLAICLAALRAVGVSEDEIQAAMEGER